MQPEKVKLTVEERVRSAAEKLLQANNYVRPVDVLVDIGWLQPVHLKDWQFGKVPFLEKVIQCNLGKLTRAMQALRKWALAKGLNPRETAYVSHGTKCRRPLRFSKSGTLSIEKYYCTHYVSPVLKEKKLQRLTVLAEKEVTEKVKDIVLPPPLNLIDHFTLDEKEFEA